MINFRALFVAAALNVEYAFSISRKWKSAPVIRIMLSNHYDLTYHE